MERIVAATRDSEMLDLGVSPRGARAPITAKLIGDWIVDGKKDDCLRDFRPDRF